MNVYYSQNQKERNDFNRALTFGQYTQLNDWLVSIVTRTPIMCICKFILLFTTLLDIVVIVLNAVKQLKCSTFLTVSRQITPVCLHLTNRHWSSSTVTVTIGRPGVNGLSIDCGT